MILLVALATGLLFGGAIYLLLRRSAVRLLVGLVLLGNGAGLLLFTMGRLRRARPLDEPGAPLVGADPLAQALAISGVFLGLALLVLVLALICHAAAAAESDDMDQADQAPVSDAGG